MDSIQGISVEYSLGFSTMLLNLQQNFTLNVPCEKEKLTQHCTQFSYSSSPSSYLKQTYSYAESVHKYVKNHHPSALFFLLSWMKHAFSALVV